MIVIYNPSFLRRHTTESYSIKAAMYGFDQYILGLAPVHMRKKPRLVDRKSGPGRKMGSQFNTTISAVAVFDGDGLTIYHNVFAAIPLKPELFVDRVRQFRLGEKRPGEFETWQEVGSESRNLALILNCHFPLHLCDGILGKVLYQLASRARRRESSEASGFTKGSRPTCAMAHLPSEYR